jgi:3-deoxy-manno-octulosonate cytidylyltransferase (CMP-KDO synthetase)
LAIVAIIPARFSSTRLPGKPLSDLQGKTMIQRVHERVRLARLPERVIVATDDERIASVVRGFGGEAVLTSADHPSGTDRLAEVVRGLEDAAIVVNVQGDEPLLDPLAVDAAARALLEDDQLSMSTLSAPIATVEEMVSPSVVKVVTDQQGFALFFSRSPLPFVRTASGDALAGAREAVARGLARKHVGLYVYRREALLRFASLAPTALEIAEGLEQLRALQNGMRMKVVPLAGEPGRAVDTPEDLALVREVLAAESMS